MQGEPFRIVLWFLPLIPMMKLLVSEPGWRGINLYVKQLMLDCYYSQTSVIKKIPSTRGEAVRLANLDNADLFKNIWFAHQFWRKRLRQLLEGGK